VFTAIAVLVMSNDVAQARFDHASADAVEEARYTVEKPRYFAGHYGFTTDQTCVRTLPQPPGTVSIDPDTRMLLVDGEIIDMSGSGIMTFSRDGGFTLRGVAAEFQKATLSAGDVPIRDGFLPVCSGTYVTDENNKLSVEFDCTIDVPSLGATIQAGPVLAEGYVGRGARSITLNLLQNVQTLTVSMPGGIAEFQRVCLQRFALQRVPRPE
jgi:hypothetical protein